MKILIISFIINLVFGLIGILLFKSNMKYCKVKAIRRVYLPIAFCVVVFFLGVPVFFQAFIGFIFRKKITLVWDEKLYRSTL